MYLSNVGQKVGEILMPSTSAVMPHLHSTRGYPDHIDVYLAV
jgi:hypothetical protein